MKKFMIYFLSVIFLCSCSIPIKQEETSTENTDPGLTETTNRDTDCINTAVSGDFDFQPHSVKNENSRSALGFMYEPLFAFEADMTPVPVLAESLEKKDNVITVHLKKNVMFHDGSYLTPSDVVYSVNLILNRVSTYTADNIVSAKEKGASSVVITLKHPAACPEELLTFPIVKNKAPQKMERPNGTGAFTFYAEQGFDTYILKRFESYHGEKPKYSTLKLITCTSDEQLKQMFDIGETDIITADSNLLASFTPRTNSTLFSYPINEMIFIGFNNSRVPKSVRRAVYLALKKKELTEKYFSHAAEYTDYPIIPSYIKPDASAYSAEDAESEMKNDGYELKDGMFVKGGKNAEISFMLESEEYDALFEEISAALKIFGISCTKVQTSFYYDKLSSSDFDACIGCVKAGCDMTDILGEGNPFLYENPDFLALARYDKENAAAAVKIFENDAPIVPICFRKSAVSAGNKISNELSPCYTYPYYDFCGWILK